MIELVFQSTKIRWQKRGEHLWFCLTDMANAHGKRFPDWKRLDSTKAFLKKLESVVGFCTTETVQGGQPHLQGTWAIQEVAIEFAGWCSVDFKIWMLGKIKTLMNEGSVSLFDEPKVPQNYIEALEAHLKSEKDKLVLQEQLEHQKLHIDTVSEYLYFLDKRHWESAIYDQEKGVYICNGDSILTLDKVENIDKYILKQEYPIPEENIFKKEFSDIVENTFGYKKNYLTVFDIVNICLTKHTRSFVTEDEIARLLVSLIIEVYLPLSPIEHQKSIHNFAECLCDMWWDSLERYAFS